MSAYSLPAGDTFALKIPLLVDGVATPIAGWLVWLAVVQYEDQADADALALLSLGSGIATYDATSWLATLPSATTAATAPLTYYYFIRARSPAGEISVLESGTLELTPARPAAALP